MSPLKKILINPVFLALAYIFGLLGILFIGTVVGIRRVPDSAQSSQNHLVPVYSDRPVSQSVTPLHNGFNVAVIYLRNASLLNRDPLVFTLTDARHHLIRQIDLNGYNVGDGTNVRFQFLPVPDSAGQTYTLTLSAPATTPGHPKIEIGFSGSGSMAFQLYYRPQNTLSFLKELSQALFRRLISRAFIIAFVMFTLFSAVIFKTLQFDTQYTPGDQ